jgi:hypothetical protein
MKEGYSTSGEYGVHHGGMDRAIIIQIKFRCTTAFRGIIIENESISLNNKHWR